MAAESGRSLRLAKRLRDLRENEWPDLTVTQADLARALSTHTKVASTTISSWESQRDLKAPTAPRLNAYALFFASRRSLSGSPHLLTVDDMDEDERSRYEELRAELLFLHGVDQDDDEPVEVERRAPLWFPDSGPVVVICPQAPAHVLGGLGDEDDVNHNRLHRYADLDALVEMFGHLRALNPAKPVFYRLSSDVQQAELQNHFVLIGGIAWNRTVRDILKKLRELPIEQIPHDSVTDGEPFRLKKSTDPDERVFFPVSETYEGETTAELVEDVALVARLPNPYNSSRTLTICNGVYSKGVLGAVMTLTDETVRARNEQYLGSRFPEGAFAMLIRVPVVAGKVLAPDLQNPETRLFEWPPGSSSPNGVATP